MQGCKMVTSAGVVIVMAHTEKETMATVENLVTMVVMVVVVPGDLASTMQ